jgi:Protein of unknown function (DUF1587)/Planctomycete cytochrome C
MKHLNFTTASLFAISLSSAVSGAEFAGRLEPMFETHCYACHDADEKKGGLDLSALRWDPASGDNLDQWTRVFDKVQSGAMPPRKKSRPDAKVAAAFQTTLSSALNGFTREQQLQAGRVVYRRLNRAEYINTVRDLFGVPAELKELLPQDGTEQDDGIGLVINLTRNRLSVSQCQGGEFKSTRNIGLRINDGSQEILTRLPLANASQVGFHDAHAISFDLVATQALKLWLVVKQLAAFVSVAPGERYAMLAQGIFNGKARHPALPEACKGGNARHSTFAAVVGLPGEVHFLESGLRVKCVDVRRPAFHHKEDDVFGLHMREVALSRCERVFLGLLREQGAEGDTAEARAQAVEKAAAGGGV